MWRSVGRYFCSVSGVSYRFSEPCPNVDIRTVSWCGVKSTRAGQIDGQPIRGNFHVVKRWPINSPSQARSTRHSCAYNSQSSIVSLSRFRPAPLSPVHRLFHVCSNTWPRWRVHCYRRGQLEIILFFYCGETPRQRCLGGCVIGRWNAISALSRLGDTAGCNSGYNIVLSWCFFRSYIQIVDGINSVACRFQTPFPANTCTGRNQFHIQGVSFNPFAKVSINVSFWSGIFFQFSGNILGKGLECFFFKQILISQTKV